MLDAKYSWNDDLVHRVKSFIAQALTNMHEKAGVKYRLKREMIKSQEILHVGVFLNGFNGSPVILLFQVFDNQSANNDARVYTACTHVGRKIFGVNLG